MQRLIVFIVSVALVMASPGASNVRAQTLPSGADAARAATRTLMTSLRTLRDDIDRARIDVEALSFELVFEDPDTIVGFVRDEIAFEGYAGLLRGAQGTLVDGAGNALDQALLLALLLGDAGYDVRIAQGRLTRDQAEVLVRSMGTRFAVGPDDALIGASEAFADALGLSSGVVASVAGALDTGVSALRAEAYAAAQFIERHLQAAGIELGGADVDALIEEARAYHWVEYGLNDEWHSAHVAFPAEAVVEVDALDHLLGDIPQELQHRFRFQVLIEQRLGGELVVKPVTEAWERPVANLHGVALTYVNVPDGAEEGVEVTLDAVLAATNFFVPMFQGSTAPGAQAFDLAGNSLSPTDASDQAAGVVKTVGGLFGGAAGALDGEPDPDDFVTLTAQWIEYTLIAPGGAETVYRRTVVDRIGTERREAGVVEIDPDVTADLVASALATSYSFMLAPGRYSDDFVLDRAISASLATEAVLEETFDGFDAPDDAEIATTASEVEARVAMEHLNLFAAFDAGAAGRGAVVYRAEPSLVVVERHWAGGSAQVDVVHNRRRVLQSTAGELPRFDVGQAIDIGTWETRVEGLPIARADAELHSVFSTLAEATAAGIPFDVLAPHVLDAVGSLDLPHATLLAIEDDLAAGYAVIAPRALPNGAEHVGWWRIDPRTGETLGRGGDGRGQTLAEYEQTLRNELHLMRIGFGMGGLQTVLGCGNAKSGKNFLCCVAEGALIAGVMVGVGVVAGGLFGLSAIFLFVALDIGVGSALMTASLLGAVPTFCNAIVGGCPSWRSA
ncbi:hypothetical protein BH23DEI1_BH23DEI1_13020 [soil metagenome]